ncbi:MAG: hypothetical protein WBO04_07175 [Steroidobacteraceae bacterium]
MLSTSGSAAPLAVNPNVTVPAYDMNVTLRPIATISVDSGNITSSRAPFR